MKREREREREGEQKTSLRFRLHVSRVSTFHTVFFVYNKREKSPNSKEKKLSHSLSHDPIGERKEQN